MVTSNGDKNTVENDESCFGWLRDHRVRHKKVHLFIFFFSLFHYHKQFTITLSMI